MKFSERIGAVRRALQKDSMDDALKNSLRNVVYQWNLNPQGDDEGPQRLLLLALWTDHFCQPVDAAAERFTRLLAQTRKRYLESGWRAVYDFLEFVASYSGSWEDYNSRFIAKVNATLERHLSSYRFVGTTLAPITSEEEIAAVEQAMARNSTRRLPIWKPHWRDGRIAHRRTTETRSRSPSARWKRFARLLPATRRRR